MLRHGGSQPRRSDSRTFGITTMAEPYRKILDKMRQIHSPQANVACKHFFSGAALYVEGSICASLTPVGLAFKLPEEVCARLIESGVASDLRYFPNSPIKKGYALFPSYQDLTSIEIASYLERAIAHVRMKSKAT